LKNTAREAFCYLGRLTFRDEVEQLLTLLPQEEQTFARALFSEIEKISDEDVRQRLIRLREAEL